MELELTARNFLRGLGFPCEFYVPETIPPSLVTVKRTSRPGSTRFIGRAMLTVQAWAETRGAAESLCIEAVDALVGRGGFEEYGGLPSVDDNIAGCSPGNGPYRWDDPDINDRKRWQATVSVDYNE